MKKLLFPVLLLSIVALAGCSKEVPVNDVVIPSISENMNPIWIKITPILKTEFVEKYKYEDSCNYIVAINIDWHYYNVFRNENNGVSNSKKWNLNGGIAMCNIATSQRTWMSWNVYFGDNKFALENGRYGYETLFLKWKPLDQYKLFTSGVKEWVEIADLVVEYIYE